MSMEIPVHIVCPPEWIDDICDPFEARVYFETKVTTLKVALLWVASKTQEIDALDSIHGDKFHLHIARQYVADIDKRQRKFHLHQDLFNKVAINLAMIDPTVI